MPRITQLTTVLVGPAIALMVCAMVPRAGSAYSQKPSARPPHRPAQAQAVAQVSEKGRLCLECHQAVTPGIVKDWQSSKHYANAVDCATCHAVGAAGGAGAADARPDARDHHGTRIVVVVTPRKCQGCHEREGKEFQASRHADAARFIGSLDNVLGEVVGGGPAANAGCKQCHGSTVAVRSGELDPATWPNTGIGRINPDGSKGACTACHSRHAFSIAQARTPEACGKCHLGPDHPQAEIWQESKHGSRYHQALAQGKPMGLEQPAGKWLAGRSYAAGPTCASCHTSATSSQPTTHDVGARISWTLRPAVSVKQEDWEKKREAMQDVCSQCHSRAYTKGVYAQYDSVVALYNAKFAMPAKTIMDRLTAAKKLTVQPFDARIKWTYYELWHHEGRRARHGAAMAGPDYTWWHGMYEVAKVFYTEFIPQARELDPAIVNEVLGPMPEHDWFTKGMSPQQVQQILEFYKSRYGQ